MAEWAEEWVIWVINRSLSFHTIEMFKLNPFAEMQRDFLLDQLHTVNKQKTLFSILPEGNSNEHTKFDFMTVNKEIRQIYIL